MPLPEYSAMPTAIESIPALITTPCGPAGSGFCLRDQDCLFLVTANHVLYDDEDEMLCDYVDFAVWTHLDGEVTGRWKARIDLAALNPSHIIRISDFDLLALHIGSVNDTDGIGKISFFDEVTTLEEEGEGIIHVQSRQMARSFNDVKVGNEAVVVGYPLSISLASPEQLDYERPLLRKGIIAGKNSKQESIILDCPVYQGNSGGPVLEIYRCGNHCTKNHFAMLGVVSQFIPFEQQWVNNQFGLHRTEWSNSGYSVVMPLDRLLDAIDICSND